MRNILLVGNMGCGKSTIAQYLNTGYKYRRYSMAAWLKDVIQDHYKLDTIDKSQVIHGKTLREIMQILGTEGCRAADENWHVDEIIKTIDYDGSQKFVIDDIRFINECTILKSRYDCIVIKVGTDDKIRLERLYTRDKEICRPNHSSEVELNHIPYDYLIENNGDFKELQKQIDILIKEI